MASSKLPTTLPALLAVHGGNEGKALEALWSQFTSLSQQDEDHSKAQNENQKLWSIMSGLKRERDTLLRECEKQHKERSRLERRITSLEQVCKTNSIPLPEEEPLPMNGTDEGKRPATLRSLSGGNITPTSKALRTSDKSSSGRVRQTSTPRPVGSLYSQERAPSPPTSATAATFPKDVPILKRKASSVDLGKPSASQLASKSPLLGIEPIQEVSSAANSPHPSSGSVLSSQQLSPPELHSSPHFSLSSVAIHSSPFQPIFPASSNVSSSNSPVILAEASSNQDHSTKTNAGLNIDTSQPAAAISEPLSSSPLEAEPTSPADAGPLRTPTTEAASFLPDLTTPGSERGRISAEQADVFASPSIDRYLPPIPDREDLHSQSDLRPRASSAPQVPGQMPLSQSAQNLWASTSQPYAIPNSSSSRSIVQLPKLTPSSLPFVQIQVTNSHIKINDRSREVISFSIQIMLVTPEKQIQSSWAIEKKYSEVLALDALVKNKHNKMQNRRIASLPDKSLFKDHAPSKVDLRKAVLQKYLQSLVAVPLQDKTDICQFLQTNLVSERSAPVTNPAFKAGYLTKKGRWVGGWQTRFYQLKGPLLEYYESQGGAKIGEIDITGAQIGRQQTNKDAPSSSDSYRHAFLIREARRRNDKDDVDHILCAETDVERDAWVRVLAAWHTGDFLPPSDQVGPPRTEEIQQGRRSNKKVSKDDIAKGPIQPISNLQQDASNAKLFATPVSYSQHEGMNAHQAAFHHRHQRDDSFGKSSVVTSATSTAVLEQDTNVNAKQSAHISRRRNELADLPASNSLPSNLDSIVSNGPLAAHIARPSSEMGHHNNASSGPSRGAAPPHAESQFSNKIIPSSSANRPVSPEKQMLNKISGPMNPAPIGATFKQSVKQEDRRARTKSTFWNFAVRADKQAAVVVQARPVFGVPLQDAVNVARVKEDFDLPAVVYRCVEYLVAKNAETEEGLYRLSGSANDIKALRERFNNEGDVNLLGSGDYYDVHAIAGLLKLFLRELPVHVLTRELQPNFLQIIDLAQRKDKVNELGSLIAQLPVANYSLLRFLSAHLINVVQNEKINKMTLRNIGIVFSPTLNIPAPLFSLMLTEFDHVFRVLDDQPAPLRISDESVDGISRSISMPDVHVESAERRRSRNSIYYAKMGADTLMETRGSVLLEGTEEESEDEESDGVEESSVESIVDGLARAGPPQGSPHLGLSTPSPLASGSSNSDSYFDTNSHHLGRPAQGHEYQQRAIGKGLAIQTQINGASGKISPTLHSAPSPQSLGLPKSPRPLVGAR